MFLFLNLDLSVPLFIGAGRIKTQAAHFWNFLRGLLCTGTLVFRL